MNTWRGHKIELIAGAYYYENGLPVKGNHLPCGYCGLKDTIEGYDGCIGEIPGAVNACCGHNCPAEAYIQFKDKTIRGKEAINYMKGLKWEEK